MVKMGILQCDGCCLRGVSGGEMKSEGVRYGGDEDGGGLEEEDDGCDQG